MASQNDISFTLLIYINCTSSCDPWHAFVQQILIFKTWGFQCKCLTHWRHFDFAMTRIYHRPQLEYTGASLQRVNDNTWNDFTIIFLLISQLTSRPTHLHLVPAEAYPPQRKVSHHSPSATRVTSFLLLKKLHSLRRRHTRTNWPSTPCVQENLAFAGMQNAEVRFDIVLKWLFILGFFLLLNLSAHPHIFKCTN